jgi:hypothetical protein
MTVPLWVSELAAAFWETAGGLEPLPRGLCGPIGRSPLELTIEELPGLSIPAVEHYLGRRGVRWQCGEPARRLRACLAAFDGAGLILIEAADPLPERTFSLAHELAHFLRHYRQPRQLACRVLGEGVRDVFDGRRPPTPEERVHALLRNVALHFHVHLMGRGPRLQRLTWDVAIAEEEADRLAYELLAPAQDVLARAGRNRDRVVDVLQEVFALPAEQAADYARLLLPPARVDPLLARLRRKL